MPSHIAMRPNPVLLRCRRAQSTPSSLRLVFVRITMWHQESFRTGIGFAAF